MRNDTEKSTDALWKKNERLKKQMLLLNVFGKGWFQNNAAIMNVNNVCIMMALSSQGIENAL